MFIRLCPRKEDSVCSSVCVHFIIEMAIPKILFSFLGCNFAEEQQGDEVGDCHQGIHAFGNVPDNVKADNAAEEEGYDVKNAVETVRLSVLDVVDGAFAIVTPA